MVKLDLPACIEQQGLRIIGRHHSCVEFEQFTQMAFAMDAYAKQAVDFYCDLTQTERAQLERVPMPSLNEASFSDQDFEEQGALHQVAAKILMNTLWLARLSRPDLSFIVARLATKISRWSRADDKQLFRLVCYLCHTADSEAGLERSVPKADRDSSRSWQSPIIHMCVGLNKESQQIKATEIFAWHAPAGFLSSVRCIPLKVKTVPGSLFSWGAALGHKESEEPAGIHPLLRLRTGGRNYGSKTLHPES